MTSFDLSSVDHLLSTTRSVRKRLDLTRDVPLELVTECIRLAVQAPTGSNQQGWRWMVITDPDKRAKLADFYRTSFTAYRAMGEQAPKPAMASERAAQQDRVIDSAEYLAEHLHEVPVFVIPCVMGRADGAPNFAWSGLLGSILPAAWSFMLAARSRGLGTAWTTLHLAYEKESAELLGIPYESVTQAALFPVAYYTGDDFKPASRGPVEKITYLDSWKSSIAGA